VDDDLTCEKQELVIFVGFPASGKSTLAKTYMIPKGYVHVNRDTLKDQNKCLNATKEALSQGKSVVVDNTNPSKQVRETYINLAKQKKIPIRCFRFQIPEKLAKHLNYYRERLTNGQHEHVSTIGYRLYSKHFEEPHLNEGFDKIVHINFIPKFKTDHERKLFYQYA